MAAFCLLTLLYNAIMLLQTFSVAVVVFKTSILPIALVNVILESVVNSYWEPTRESRPPSWLLKVEIEFSVPLFKVSKLEDSVLKLVDSALTVST